MKARAVRPVYWRDRELAAWTPAQREFYIGCWMLCDDAGIMRSDLWEVAAELFPYATPKARERTVQKLWDHVVSAGKVVPMACGRHAAVPAVPLHGMGGRPTEYLRQEHERRCVPA